MLLSEKNPPLNSPTYAEVGFLKMVATVASVAELGTGYDNAKICACERRTLEEIGHPQA